jgi:hypothetical protein
MLEEKRAKLEGRKPFEKALTRLQAADGAVAF